MCVAAKFGPGDPLFAGGKAFALDYLLGDLNQTVRHLANPPDDTVGHPSHHVFDHDGRLAGSVSTDPDAEFNACLWQYSTPHLWANVFVQCVVSTVLVPHIGHLRAADLAWDQRLGIYLDAESRSFGVRILVSTFKPIAEMMLDPDSDVGTNPFHLKSNDTFCLYTVQLSVTDQFDPIAETEKHDVQSHERQLPSGKVVPVKPHKRHNPTRGLSRKLNLAEVAHVVYRAYDKTGMLRYVGEGTEDRPHHVNSGISHNFKLNQHFFLHGEMRIEVVASGLSKGEAVALEYLLIKKHAGDHLWNVRDNVPAIPPLPAPQ